VLAIDYYDMAACARLKPARLELVTCPVPISGSFSEPNEGGNERGTIRKGPFI
jgi:hypothetical protein